MVCTVNSRVEKKEGVGDSHIDHARIQEFSSGGPGQSDKKSSDVFFCFFSPQLILLKSNV